MIPKSFSNHNKMAPETQCYSTDGLGLALYFFGHMTIIFLDTPFCRAYIINKCSFKTEKGDFMPRPKHPRAIHAPPSVDGFKPRSGGGQQGEVNLTLEEFEAIRLVDFEGLDQIQASALMGVSRQTFGRVLRSGRFTLSKALVKGLPLTVGGGCYEIRGNRNIRGHDNPRGRQRCRRGTMAEPMEQQITSSGGNIMVENNATDEKDSKGTPPPGKTPGQGRGQGQGRGRGLGGGKGDGSCRKKDGGRGRGMGGGKGSCGA